MVSSEAKVKSNAGAFEFPSDDHRSFAGRRFFALINTRLNQWYARPLTVISRQSPSGAGMLLFQINMQVPIPALYSPVCSKCLQDYPESGARQYII